MSVVVCNSAVVITMLVVIVCGAKNVTSKPEKNVTVKYFPKKSLQILQKEPG